jgi:hypothetical protein
MNERNILLMNEFRRWGLLTATLISFFALLPQVDLWISRGTSWNGTYAISADDEPAYAAYLQSIIDGKPRRNSPYSGTLDTAENPQKESLFSIQFFTTYPLALISRAFGISSSTAMILLSLFGGFASAISVFWLFYLLSENAHLSFVGTIAVLLTGWLSAGSANAFSLIFSNVAMFEYTPLLFLRRTNPAVSFPILFLFFSSIWKFLNAKTDVAKLISVIGAVLCFGAIVYSYFYHWTAAIAWFIGLSVLWTIFRFDHFRKNIIYFVGLGFAFSILLVPYFMLLSNRSQYTDSIQLLLSTHEPDLLRMPELISYFTITLLLLSYKHKWLDLDKSKYIFLLSISLVAPIVFNQQILTGQSLQPFHYQLYGVNYISLFPFIAVTLLLIAHNTEAKTVKTSFILICLTTLTIFSADIIWGNNYFHEERIWLDELKPVAERIKAISNSYESPERKDPLTVMTFDLTNEKFPNSTYLPALSSQSVLWSVHILMFPDVDADENLRRMNEFIYYHNLAGKDLKNSLATKFLLPWGFFGPGRVFPQLTTESNPITESEIDNVVRKYEDFRRNFSYEDAKRHKLSFVLVRNDTKNDLSAIDRWYVRDSGEIIGSYTLFQVKLRKPNLASQDSD